MSSRKGLFLLVWVFFVHLAGLYLYTRGFLLTRLALSERTTCHDGLCTLAPTHKRAIVLIIDALRSTSSGLTTGSLPTFIDMGANFGGASVAEDTLISQLRDAGKKQDSSAPRTNSAPLSLLPTRLFPGATVPHRSVQQIDLVPSLALLLGIPIPYNNLGTVIPELFGRDGQLERALELNSQQVKQYLDTYRASASGGELDGAWGDLQERWTAVQNTRGDETQWIAMEAYTRFALAVCRELWAQFNVTLIGLGLTVLAVGTFASVVLYAKLGELKEDWVDWAAKARWLCVRGMAAGSILGVLAYLPLRSFVKGLDALHCVLFGAPLVSSLVVIATARPSLSSLRPTASLIPLILHALAFASNSFTIWEDRIITYLLLSSVAPSVLAGLSAPTARLRYRILGFSALFAFCVRAMAASTVCREEQHPYCHVTFFASSSLPEPPLLVLVLAVPVALGLPWAVRWFCRCPSRTMALRRLCSRGSSLSRFYKARRTGSRSGWTRQTCSVRSGIGFCVPAAR
ncbi:uncharacterized protein B0H18DRAFT_1023529 [Fomitopsis serialis]|uniref:uncharacterized protein n=1 Tax=Fomitopsis serialis TaxID=139415 RepID=UPI002007BFDC|nr:uncharacterized protein B0H18DRAFT_1023529 [Neoantrodia serialis]KAH9920605.1 hypothetical protein B0H18DRAFT_1023529 [Neoantrodia serialis]